MKTFFSFFTSTGASSRASQGRILLFLTFFLWLACILSSLISGKQIPPTTLLSVEGILNSLLLYEGYKKARTVVDKKLNKGPDPTMEK